MQCNDIKIFVILVTNSDTVTTVGLLPTFRIEANAVFHIKITENKVYSTSEFHSWAPLKAY